MVKDLAARGLGRQALQALKDIDYRLKVYPQFGEPLKDLHMTGQTLWIASVPPFVVRYIIDDENRVVYLAAKFMLLSGT
jgi:hypothetical protein